MGGVSVKHTEETGDLLSLIEQLIDELRLSISLFEASQREGGLEHLAVVVEAIDAYLGRLESDPLLRLAPIAPAEIREGLDHIRSDLDEVIQGLSATPS
jgi:proline dehydrogenase